MILLPSLRSCAQTQKTWCSVKGHLSSAAVPMGWACVLAIRGRLDSAPTRRWQGGVCQRPRWPFPQVHVGASSSIYRQRFLSASARCTLLIYFPSPPSVYPPGCCSTAAWRCYNWRRVNIYHIQWGWRLHGGGSLGAMTSRRAETTEQTFVRTQVIGFLHGGGRAKWVTEERSGWN